jgi:hypothetical protein
MYARDFLMDREVLQPPNNMVERPGPELPAAHHERSADKAQMGTRWK